MKTVYKLLRKLTPLVLLLFIAVSFAAPLQEQQNYKYLVSAPTQVDRDNTFELTVGSAKEMLNQKDVDIILPPGFQHDTYTPTFSTEGYLVYKIKAAHLDGDYTIYIQVNSTATRNSTTLTQKITVQQSYFEKNQTVFFIAVAMVFILVITGGGAK